MTDYADIEFDEVVYEGPKADALLIRIDNEKHWIQKKHIDMESYDGTCNNPLRVEEWVAVEKGLV